MSQTKADASPDFLVASTEIGLRRLMRLNNLKRATRHEYKIYQRKDGKHIAWYTPETLTLEERIKRSRGEE